MAFAFLRSLNLLFCTESIGSVVLEDIGHVLNRFLADFLCCDYLDIIEPLVGVVSLLRRLVPQTF